MFEPYVSTGESSPGTEIFAAVAMLLTVFAIASSYLGMRLPLLVSYLAVAMTVMLTPLASRYSTKDQDRIFLMLIGSASLSMLLSTTLSSPDLLGWDIHQEFNLFNQVLKAGNWIPQNNMQYNSVLSITILPAVYALVTDLDGLTIFRVMYPALYSAAPIILYQIYRKAVGPASAYLAAFFVIAYPTFYIEMPSLARQEVAVFILASLILILLSTRSAVNRRAHAIVAVILVTGVITAHYSIAYILIAVLGLGYVLSRLSRKYQPLIGLQGILLTIAIAFTWYLFLSLSGFVPFLSYVEWVAQGFVYDLFNPSSRPVVVLQAVGLSSVTSGLLHDINRVTYYLTNGVFLLGFIRVALARPKTTAERRIFPLLLAGFVMLLSAVILPNVASGLNLSRVYALVLLFSSPCFAYGVGGLERASRLLQSSLHKRSNSPAIDRLSVSSSGSRRSRALAASLLLLFFLFSSGWIWAVSSDLPTSQVLDSHRMFTSANRLTIAAIWHYHTSTQDIAAARWSIPYLPHASLCADYGSRANVLTSYGARGRQTYQMSDVLPACNFQSSFVFSSGLNALGMAQDSREVVSWHDLFNITVENRVFSDGGAAIFGPARSSWEI